MFDKFISKFSYFFGSAIAIAAIVWSYVEPGYYENYIKGSIFLFWTAYIFPWVILIAIWTHFYIDVIKNWRDKNEQ